RPPAFDSSVETLTPDDLMAGRRPAGERILLFDDDHYYLGGVLAELLAAEGKRVTPVTSAPRVSEGSVNTVEHAGIHSPGVDACGELEVGQALAAVAGETALLVDALTRSEREVPVDGLVLVTARLPEDGLATQLLDRRAEWSSLESVRLVGDAYAPG